MGQKERDLLEIKYLLSSIGTERKGFVNHFMKRIYIQCEAYLFLVQINKNDVLSISIIEKGLIIM